MGFSFDTMSTPIKRNICESNINQWGWVLTSGTTCTKVVVRLSSDLWFALVLLTDCPHCSPFPLSSKHPSNCSVFLQAVLFKEVQIQIHLKVLICKWNTVSKVSVRICAWADNRTHTASCWLTAVWLTLLSHKYFGYCDLMWLQMILFPIPPSNSLCFHVSSPPHLSHHLVVSLSVTEGDAVTNLVSPFQLCKLRGRKTSGLVPCPSLLLKDNS